MIPATRRIDGGRHVLALPQNRAYLTGYQGKLSQKKKGTISDWMKKIFAVPLPPEVMFSTVLTETWRSDWRRKLVTTSEGTGSAGN